MEDWKREFTRAKYYLSKHRPGESLKHLENALSGCPVSNFNDLSQILFFLGIALRKLGLSESAIKSWSAGSRLSRNGSAARMLKRFQNEYGMKKQGTRQEDDWNAFYAIHLNRYIRRKTSGGFGTTAERDMVNDLIRERFTELSREYSLQILTAAEKYCLFHSVVIVFPFILPVRPVQNEDVSVNFIRKERILPDDSCFCGSGRPFMQCCGRAPGIQEIMNGLL